MEFIITNVDKSTNTPAMNREVLHLFNHWQPPASVNLKSLYFTADGRRGFGLVEADNVAAVAEAIFPFLDYLEFEVIPVIPAQQGAEVLGKAHAWADSVKGHGH